MVGHQQQFLISPTFCKTKYLNFLQKCLPFALFSLRKKKICSPSFCRERPVSTVESHAEPCNTVKCIHSYFRHSLFFVYSQIVAASPSMRDKVVSLPQNPVNAHRTWLTSIVSIPPRNTPLIFYPSFVHSPSPNFVQTPSSADPPTTSGRSTAEAPFPSHRLSVWLNCNNLPFAKVPKESALLPQFHPQVDALAYYLKIISAYVLLY